MVIKLSYLILEYNGKIIIFVDKIVFGFSLAWLCSNTNTRELKDIQVVMKILLNFNDGKQHIIICRGPSLATTVLMREMFDPPGPLMPHNPHHWLTQVQPREKFLS